MKRLEKPPPFFFSIQVGLELTLRARDKSIGLFNLIDIFKILQIIIQNNLNFHDSLDLQYFIKMDNED